MPSALTLLALLTVAAPSEVRPLSVPPYAIARVKTREKIVALTFDACATRKQANGFDRPVFEILSREQIPVTVYLSGRWVEMHPVEAKLLADSPFVEFGNHAYAHSRLSLLRDPKRLYAEIRDASLRIGELGKPALTLRPPAGAWTSRVATAARREHLPLVLWDVISGDAGGHVPADRITAEVLSRARPGSIIIFHINDRAPFTREALPGIVAGLREKGFRFVTVSQLLRTHDAVLVRAKMSRFGFHRGGPAPRHRDAIDAHPST